MWVSTSGIDQDLSKTNPNIKTEFWMMNADGSNKHRLTYFNEPGAPEYRPTNNTPASVSWSPDGKSIVGLVQLRSDDTKLDAFPGSIVRITLP